MTSTPRELVPEEHAPAEFVVSRLLVVDDDERLAHELVESLRDCARERRSCGTARAALALMSTWQPQLVLLDVNLPDGSAVSVLEKCSQAPHPVAIAVSGAAIPTDTFRLGQLGVRAFLCKPLEYEALRRTIVAVMSHAPDAAPVVRGAVGRVGLREMESQVRQAMVDEALGRSRGSLSGAARTLDVSRQALQQILKRR